MKNVLITVLSLLVVILTLNNLQAQEKDKEREVRVKIKTVKNGKETVIDSVFTLDKDVKLQDVMKSLGHDVDIDELHEHEGDHEKKEIRIEKRVEKKINKNKDGDEEAVEIDVHIDGDSEKEIIIIKGEGEELDEDIKIKVLGEGDNVFIFKEGDEDNGQVKKKKIKIMKDAGEESKVIWKSEDGEEIEIEGKELEKDMVFIRKRSDDTDPLDDEEIKKMLKEKGIDWEELKEKEHVMITKTHDLSVNFTPTEKENVDMLLKTGLEENDINSGLEVDGLHVNYEDDGPFLLTLNTKESGHLMAVLRDAKGEVVSKTVLKESSNAYKIYFTIDESGSYYVTLSQGGKSLTQKLVIKKA